MDDRNLINDAELVTADWPKDLIKPVFGIVQDYGIYPRWSKYCRFLDNNDFKYDFYNVQAHDWLEKAEQFDIIIGIQSCELYCLQEMRRKYYVLEKFLGKTCYPSTDHALLYEDKCLEAYISETAGIPFARTHISNDKQDALQMVESLKYPQVSKINPSSGSIGVQLVHNPKKARKIVEQAFGRNGKQTHRLYERQKDYAYFQDFIPNDGYDIRVIVVGNRAFGYYRKILVGDFRASGMNQVEKRELPEEAIHIALSTNKVIKSPMLVVDMVHGLDGKFYVIEFSPICQMEFPEQLHVDGISGAYIVDDDGMIHFQKARYWVQELALKQFLLDTYIPKIMAEGQDESKNAETYIRTLQGAIF